MDAIYSGFNSGSLCCWLLQWLLLNPVLLVVLNLLGLTGTVAGFGHFTLLPPATSTVLRGSHSLINRPLVWPPISRKKLLRLLTSLGRTPRPTVLWELLRELREALRFLRKALLNNFNYKSFGKKKKIRADTDPQITVDFWLIGSKFSFSVKWAARTTMAFQSWVKVTSYQVDTRLT